MNKRKKINSLIIEPVTIKWTNQWTRSDDLTTRLKPPDKKPPDKHHINKLIIDPVIDLRQKVTVEDDQDLKEDFIHKRKIKLKTPSTIDKHERYEEKNDHIHKTRTKLKTFQTNLFMNKQKQFELNEDHIHKPKIKLKVNQLDAILGETKAITIRIQEQMILRQNLERWLKEKDKQDQTRSKIETKLVSLNEIKERKDS
jgi:hypothetical protein